MNCKFLFFAGIICVLLLAGCSAEDRYNAVGTGQLSPVLTADFSVPLSVDPSVLTTTSSQPETKDFAVAIVREDGTLFKSWDTFGEFPENMKFPLGSFVFKASYGNIDKEGFEMPYFEGSEPFQVFDKQNTDISVTCTLANAKVSLVYTDAFKNYFSDFATTLKTEKNNSIIFSKDETREAYVKPGKITLQMSLVKPDGSSMVYSPEIFIAEPCKHYRVNFDVNEGNVGGAALSIIFDESTELNPITINLAEDEVSLRPPFITVMGFESGTNKTVKELDTNVGDINALITAPMGFASCVMVTSSAYLQAKGWPQEVDLMELTPEQKTLFSAMGLRLKGFEHKDKMAYVDFSELVSNLEYVEGSPGHTFTLSAIGLQGRPTDEVILSITSQPRSFELQTPEPVFIGSSRAVIPIKMDGEPSDVTISYKDEDGQYKPCSVESVEPSGDMYHFTVQLAAGNTAKEIKSVYHNVKQSLPATLAVVTPPYSISKENEGDVWAKKATITVTAENPENQAAVMEYLTLYSGDTKVNFTQQGDDKILVSGLTSGTEYNFKTTCTDYAGNTEFSNLLSFTTESEAAVPNGDFEDLAQTVNVSNMNQGGRWRATRTGSYEQNVCSFTIQEPVGWSSVNAKTCNTSANTQNTWFVIPSTFNTNLTWSSTVPKYGIWGGGGTETPDVYKNLSAQNGNNAMVVRNVAWDANGTTPPDESKTAGSSGYYNTNVPTIANRSAGELFLGSYSYVNGSETKSEGVSFDSRPAALKGYYKYKTEVAGENGIISVTLLNGNTVIGTGSKKLSAVEGYTEFDIPVTYTTELLKATQLRIMILSSDQSDIQTTNSNGRYESASRGAELTVDNLTFSY